MLVSVALGAQEVRLIEVEGRAVKPVKPVDVIDGVAERAPVDGWSVRDGTKGVELGQLTRCRIGLELVMTLVYTREGRQMGGAWGDLHLHSSVRRVEICDFVSVAVASRTDEEGGERSECANLSWRIHSSTPALVRVLS